MSSNTSANYLIKCFPIFKQTLLLFFPITCSIPVVYNVQITGQDVIAIACYKFHVNMQRVRGNLILNNYYNVVNTGLFIIYPGSVILFVILLLFLLELIVKRYCIAHDVISVFYKL